MNEDLRELLACLRSRGVRFLIVGAHAVSFYSRPRATDDLDLWVEPSPENADALKGALDDFGAPIGESGALLFSQGDRQMIRLGVPPNMVDILNFSGDQEFNPIWERRVRGELSGIPVDFPCRDDLIAIKRAVGRPQDLVDVQNLENS